MKRSGFPAQKLSLVIEVIDDSSLDKIMGSSCLLHRGKSNHATANRCNVLFQCNAKGAPRLMGRDKFYGVSIEQRIEQLMFFSLAPSL